MHVDAAEDRAYREQILADLLDQPGESLVENRRREPITGVHRGGEPIAKRLPALELLLGVVRGVVLLGRPLRAHRRADRREIRVRGEVVGLAHPQIIRHMGTRPVQDGRVSPSRAAASRR